MRKTPALILCLLIIAFGAHAADVEESTDTNEMVISDGVVMGKFTHDYDAALAHASKQGLPVMLVFTGSDWCGWCKTMDKNVFAKPEWEAYAEDSIVQVWLDFPRNKDLVPEKYRERNELLKEEYGIRGYPTYIILDSNGDTIGRLGAGRDKTPESFKAELQKILIMTESGMKAYAEKIKTEDAAAVMSSYQAYKAAESDVAELEKKLDAAKQVAANKKAALDEVMETGKLNALSAEDKVEYQAAKAALAEAQEKLRAWAEQNARSRQTPELREQYMELVKAVDDAENIANRFDLQ